MISLRARIFIVISLIVFVVLSISIFLFVRAKKQAAIKDQAVVVESSAADKIDNNVSAPVSVPTTDNTSNLQVNPVSSLDIQQNAAKQIAKIFLERFNSFSSESQYQNVRDVQTLVSKSYWNQLGAKIPVVKAGQNITVPFSSAATKVYSAKIVEWSDQLATVNLQAKIMEEKNGVIKNLDKQAKVDLISDGKNWLVDKFEWVK